MLRSIALSTALFAGVSGNAAPPAQQTYIDDVEGLATLAWHATRCPDAGMRLAAVEQMVRLCAHPKRVDMVLASIESKDPVESIRASARRVRMQLRLETSNWAWVDAEEKASVGRSVVAHDPIPYREALASLRNSPAMPMTASTGMQTLLPRR